MRMPENWSGRRALAAVPASAATLFFCLTLLAALGYGQSLTGRWVATGKTMDNGEARKAILELTQTGNDLTGKLVEFGGGTGVKGTAMGNHFELFGVGWDDKKPFLVGDLVNGELHGTQWDEAFVAKPATPADEFPKLPYLEPPALHNVPYDGLAKTPPMGWNSWNLFAEKVDDQTVRTMADAMVSSGMRDAGYIYVNIDDTWQGVRDAQGNLQSNHKFPDMKALADYVHSKGLKLGIYSSPGPRTCAGYPASYGHEEQDARTFASWGIDYLKYDWCSASNIYNNDMLQPVYQKMGDALAASGRPIVYSLCEYGMGSVEKWGSAVGGNLWRTTDDINDSWESMIANIESQAPTAPYAGPGHWNDPDMLEIGNRHMTDEQYRARMGDLGGVTASSQRIHMTDDEYRTHMSLWALAAAPLLAGNDIRTMSEVTKSILLNREVIAVDQDALGKQASPVKNGDLETWVKPLADGSVAVGVVNLGSAPAQAKVQASDLQLGGEVKKARDLWAHTDVKFTGGAYSAAVPSHGVLLLKVSAK
jgi:alpha-galactosidase